MTQDLAYDIPDMAPLPVDNNEGSTAYRVLPHNLEAEQGLLGALLVDNRALEKVSDFLRANHFFMPAHQRIFETIQTIIERGQTATPVTLKNYFEKDEDLSEIGGAGYLADLAATVISVINVEDYARTIFDLHVRRELITLGEDIVNQSYNHSLDSDSDTTIESAEAKLFELAETGDVKGGFVTLRDSVLIAIEHAEKAYKTAGNVTGVTSGLADIDKKLGGFQKSDLLILAGRPSMGKTALAVNWAFNAAKAYADSGGEQGGRVAFFSLEMAAEQLAGRILSEQSEIPSDAIRKGNIKQEDFRRFVEASQRMSQVPLYIDDTPALSIGAVRTRCRRLKRQHGLDMIVVDYLQLLRGNGSRQSSENRVLEISEITRGLKAIAKELDIPVIALSQLSRAVEQREDKRPQLSDLRESGSIEQDADIVMFVYREEYYLSRTEPDPGTDKHLEWQERMERAHNIGECIVAKQRHGPIGAVKMFFDPNFTRFSDLDPNHFGAYGDDDYE
ncbi:MAG: replicative DNA helicase [Micavibrio sp.]|nr:replicative DNA helicase [Micavibrio sp.]